MLILHYLAEFAEWFSGAALQALYEHFGDNIIIPYSVFQIVVIKHSVQLSQITEKDVAHVISSMELKRKIHWLFFKSFREVLDIMQHEISVYSGCIKNEGFL